MRKINIFILLLLATLLQSCDKSTKDYEVGPNGEPPKALKESYTNTFKIDQKNYVIALGEIHKFLIENSFYPIIYSECFDATLDVRVTANLERYSETYPCDVVQAEKGTPEKAYLVAGIEEVKFNQLDDDNRLLIQVKIYGLEAVSQVFKLNLEPVLNKQYGAVSHNQASKGMP